MPKRPRLETPLTKPIEDRLLLLEDRPSLTYDEGTENIIEGYKSEISALHKKIAELTARYKNARNSELATFTQRIAQKETEMTELDEEIHALNHNISDLTAKLTNMNGMIEHSKHTISVLNEENTRIRGLLQATASNHQDVVETVHAVLSEKAQKDIVIEVLRQRITGFQEEIDNLRVHAANLQDDNRKIFEELNNRTIQQETRVSAIEAGARLQIDEMRGECQRNAVEVMQLTQALLLERSEHNRMMREGVSCVERSELTRLQASQTIEQLEVLNTNLRNVIQRPPPSSDQPDPELLREYLLLIRKCNILAYLENEFTERTNGDIFVHESQSIVENSHRSRSSEFMYNTRRLVRDALQNVQFDGALTLRRKLYHHFISLNERLNTVGYEIPREIIMIMMDNYRGS